MYKSTIRSAQRPDIAPTQSKERYIILDALRGFALAGIALANFPEFALYTFLSPEAAAAMPMATADRVARYLQYFFIDGKFYTLFSLLFGIGFSLIIANAARRHANGYRIFYRRMAWLLLIGLLHLMLLWSGDILALYALMGMTLPLFMRLPDKALLRCAAFLLLLPVAVDAAVSATGIYPSAAVVERQQFYCAKYGITPANFAYWLRDAQSYREVLQFLVQGAFVRMQEFIDGNRAFKVLGLFLLGLYIGRNRFYARIAEKRAFLRRFVRCMLPVAIPASALYAWSAVNGHPWGLPVHTLLYTVSVYPLAFCYAAGFALWQLKRREPTAFRVLAAPGRVALTNYIGQSAAGMCLFYGIGLGWGADMGLVHVLLTAAAVYALQTAFSHLWLRLFRFGPLEWMWRMLTYGKRLPLSRSDRQTPQT